MLTSRTKKFTQRDFLWFVIGGLAFSVPHAILDGWYAVAAILFITMIQMIELAHAQVDRR